MPVRFRSHWIAVFRRSPPAEPPPPPPKDGSWPTRIAWGVLLGGFTLVVARASVATVVRIHGDGMAPTIQDGDGVLLLRSTSHLELGDIVVYDPTPPPPPAEPESLPALPGEPGPDGRADPNADPRQEMHNTAVVDVDAVEERFERIQRAGKRASAGPPAEYRVGRVLARPGDAVTFHVPDAALGLAVNGVPLSWEAAPPRRGGDPQHRSMRPAAFEHAGETTYEVLVATEPVRWEPMGLPIDDGPVQLRAEGFLIVADNRDASSCCDSRALGWISEEAIRGEVSARIAARAPTTQDDPEAKRVQWLP